MSQGSRTKPVIACMADHGFARAAAVVLDSICRHFSGPALDFILLDYGLTPDQFARLQRMARRYRPAVSLHRWQRSATVPGQRGDVFERVCRDRLVVLDEMALEWPRLVMLDADLLVNADLAELWGTDLSGRVLGAVRDFAYPIVGARFPGVEAPDRPYYNTGVLLVDLKRWRDQGLTRRVADKLDMTRPSHGPYCPDQDAMNAALTGQWQELDPSWNAQMIALQHVDQWPDSAWKQHLQPRSRELYEQPNIRHWPGPYKPWLHLPGCDVPFRREYQDAMRHCGWLTPWERLVNATRLNKPSRV